jgi:TetR/AcrR family transcriptional regulator, cholesterol catabolism regulator
MSRADSPKGASNEARRGEVLAAAFDVFVERGYEAATVQDIASRVGLLKGSLYYYIESKEALLYALVKRAYDNIADYLASDDQLSKGDAPTRLCRFIDLFVGNLSNKASEAEARLVARELHNLSAPHQREIHIKAGLVESYLIDIIVQGITEGSFDERTDPRVAANSIFSVLNGASWRLRRGDQAWSAIVSWYQTFMVRGLGGICPRAPASSHWPRSPRRSANSVVGWGRGCVAASRRRIDHIHGVWGRDMRFACTGITHRVTVNP